MLAISRIYLVESTTAAACSACCNFIPVVNVGDLQTVDDESCVEYDPCDLGGRSTDVKVVFSVATPMAKS